MKTTKKLISLILCVLMLVSACSASFPVFAQEMNQSSTFRSEESDNEAAHIVSEIVDRREESAKCFLMSDGTYKIAYYTKPVHYQNESGVFIDYNNSLSEQNSTDEESVLFGESKILKTLNEKTNVVFAKKSNSKALVSYEDENFPLSFNYQSAKNSRAQVINGKNEADGDNKFLYLPNISSQVLYENVFDNVDFHYVVNTSGVKENIILKSPKAQNTFTINYDIGRLTAVKKDKNTVELTDGKNVIYTISAPVMFDAAGETSSDIEVDVVKNKNGKLRLCVTANEDWLSNENRAYPVTIDPSVYSATEKELDAAVVSSKNTSCTEDNMVISADASSEYGIAYLLLDMSAARVFGMYYDRIYKAKLSLPIVSKPQTSVRVDAHKITSEWDKDEVNWSNKPSYESSVLDYCSMSTSSKNLNMDVTKLFLQTITGEYMKESLLLKINTGSMAVSTSSDNPILTVDCGSSLGVDSSYTYNEFDMGTAGNVYINNLTGNLVLLRDEISSAGETCPYDLTSAYNTFSIMDNTKSAWIRSYQTGFNIFGMYIDTDRSVKMYQAGEDGNLKENDEGWNKLEITETKKITISIMGKEIPIMIIDTKHDAWRYDSTEKYSFENDVGLVSKYINIDPQTNPNGTLAFSREAVLNSNGEAVDGSFYIVDADGKKLKIVQTASQYSAAQIEYGSNGAEIEKNKVVYSYDANGNVLSIVKNNKTLASFTYDSSNRMTSVTDSEGHKLEFGYSGSSLGVVSIKESKNGTVGQQLSIERTYSTATVRRSGGDGVFGNNDDTYTEYRFDSYDNLVSERSYTKNGEDLGAVAYEHDASGNGGLLGTVSKVAASGKIAENLLKNHNMEKDGNWSPKYYDDSKCSYEAARVTDTAYSGTSSLKITVNSITKSGGASYSQSFNISDGILEVGKYYRMSAHIKTDGLTRSSVASSEKAYGASVMVKFTYADGTTSRSYTENVQKTDPDINGGWQRVNVGFEVPQNTTKVTVYLVVRNATGTAYFDACQLEKGDWLSQYNMLENANFSYVNASSSPESWTRHNLADVDYAVNGKMHIVGSTSKNKGVYQDVTLKDAKPEDKYVISGIASAQPVTANGKSRFYGIYVRVYYKEKDANGSQYSYQKMLAPFDSYYDGEQYICGGFDLSHPEVENLTPAKMRIVVCYYKQPNEAYFDSVSLVRSNDVYDLTAQDETNTEDGDTSYTYDEDGNILTYTDENGNVYTYNYNEFGDLISCIKPNEEGDYYTYLLYDSDGDGVNDASLPLTESYEDGTTVTYTYHANRELKTETTVSEGVTTVLTYNTDGQLVTESATKNNSNLYTYTYTYDSWGNVLTRLKADGAGDRYTYRAFDTDGDGINDKTEILTETLEDGSQNSYTYNNDAVLLGETRIKNGKTLKYVYDTNGNTTAVTHNGFTYNYTYDGYGKTKSVKVGSQPLVTYGYQNEGRLASTTYGNGSTESYTYNAYGQLSALNRTGLGKTTWRYDALGRPYYVRDYVSARKTYFYYDVNNQTVGQHVYSTAQSNAYDTRMFGINRAFNDKGKMTKESLTAKDAGITNTFTYNENGQPTQTTLTSVRKISYGYDNDSRLTSRTTSTTTPIEETFTYNNDEVLSTHRVKDGTRDNTYSYTYSDSGNITQIKKDNAVIKSYEYDDDNQLKRENDAENNRTVTYTYDGYGNILSKSVYAYTLSQNLGTPTSTKNYTYDSTWKDKLTSYGGQSITYDAIGNPTNYMGAAMTWFGRQMKSYTKGNTSVTYKYDADGLRTQKIVNGVQYDYFYVDGQLMYEKIGNDCEMFYRYDSDGRLGVALKRDLADGAKHYYYPVTNNRGDIVEIHNGPGQITAKYNYDAWGKLLSVTDANGNALASTSFAYKISVRYRGYEYDSETGLYYLQSRYYDPETGRFINADDAEFIGYSGEDISYNTFAYCENNAVMSSDATGNAVAKQVLYTLIKASYSGKYGFAGLGFYNPSAKKFEDFFDKTWSTKQYCVQKLLGYCDTYDNMAWAMGCWIHCLKSEFRSKDKNNKTIYRRIELWMGRYGISVGGEIGWYYNYNKSSKFYYCDNGKHKMNFSIGETSNGYLTKELFSISTNAHWWLTGFLYNINVAKYKPYPKNIFMGASIYFDKKEDAKAFCANLKCTGLTKTSFEKMYMYDSDVRKYLAMVFWNSAK